MPTALPDKDRKVIPRWRAFALAVDSGELVSVGTRKPTPVTLAAIDEQRVAWETNRSIGFAADWLGAATAVGRSELARDAAEFLLASPSPIPVSLLRMACRATGRGTAHLEQQPAPLTGKALIHKNIHDTRVRLRDEPRNAVLWVDLARLYELIAGQDQAARAMQMALRLAPTNRFVLRSASRMFIHQGDRERAHAVLRSNPRTRSDPWLLAAEIAAASVNTKRSTMVKEARAFLESRSIGKFHLSELASAVGTLELETGNAKKGRQLIIASLEKPTENAIAQAAWTARNFNVSDIARLVEPAALQSPEAHAWALTRSSDWNNAMIATGEWQQQEPFSSRPAAQGSYLASVAMAEYEQGVRFADRGLVANPHEFILLNNKAVCLAKQGKAQAAQAVLEQVHLQPLDSQDRIYFVATSGLVLMRGGAIEEGRMCYLAAIDAARREGERNAVAMARTHLAIEESVAGCPTAQATARAALEELDLKQIPEATRLAEELRRIVNPAAPPKPTGFETWLTPE